jgi:hypothetical protein
MISPSLANSKCLFGELEKYLTNDYMTISRLLTMSKVEKALDNKICPMCHAMNTNHE